MRIGFLRAYDPNQPYQWSLPPLGIGYLAAFAKRTGKGCEFFFEKTVEALIAGRPDLAAVSSPSENFGQAAHLAGRIKAELGIPVIVGGEHSTSLPATVPPVFDAGCVGEGEETFADLLALFSARRRPAPDEFAKIPGIVYFEDGHPVVTAARPLVERLDDLPFPDRDLLGGGWSVPFSEEVHLVSSRGCPYRCAFCASSLNWKTFRQFSPEYTISEIARVRERYNPKILYFFDDLFIAQRRHFQSVCALLKERGLLEGVEFRCFGRANLIDEPMADLLAAHNFRWLDFGFESNDAATLAYLNKAGVSPETNQRCIDILAPRGISIGANLIIGSPPEDADAIGKTYDFLERNAARLRCAGFGPLVPLPGTFVWEEAKRLGLVSETMDWGRLAYSPQSFDIERFPYMGRLPKEEFLRWHERFASLCERINVTGQLRQTLQQAACAEEEMRRLRAELASYKGSRLVRAAAGLRDLRRRIWSKRARG